MGIDPTSPDFPRHVETRYQGIVRLTVIVVGISIVFLGGTCFQLVRGIVGRPLFNWNFDLNLDFGPPMGMSVAECAAPRLMAAFDRNGAGRCRGGRYELWRCRSCRRCGSAAALVYKAVFHQRGALVPRR